MTDQILKHLITEPADVYHAKASHYMSSHQLIDFMRCPFLHYKKHNGLIAPIDSTAFLLGRAAHALILEGRDEYESQFAIGGPVNPKTGKPFGERTKAFSDWTASQGKPVISNEQAELIEQMTCGVQMNPSAMRLLEEGTAEGVLRTTWHDVECQIRMDWLCEAGLVDLKTCDQLDWFEADARRWHYAHQMAFYQGVLEAATGREAAEAIACNSSSLGKLGQRDGGSCLCLPDTGKCDVHLIAVEKKEPYRCGVWQMSDDTLSIARQEVEAALERLKVAREKDAWATGYEEIRVMDI